MKIANKISLSFLVAVLILTSIAAPIFYLIARGNLQKSIYNNLDTVIASRVSHIETYLEMLKTSVGELSKSVVLENLLKINGKENLRQGEAFAVAMKRLKRTKEVNPAIAEYLLLDKAGKVAASSKESNVGLDISTDSIFLGGQKETYIKDVYYSEIHKEPIMAVSTPFLDSQTGELLGVLAAKVRLNDINNIVTEKTGMGDTGEIYIVNKYGFMITPSRFKEDVVLKQRVDTRNVRRVHLHEGREHPLSEEKRIIVFPNYRGAQVLGAHEYIPQMQWAVLAEIEARETLAPLAKIRLVFLTILFIAPIAAWLLGNIIAKVIAEPINRLSKGIEIIGSGNLDYKVGTDMKDEVGQLSRAFDAMTANLKKTTASIKDLNQEIAGRRQAEEKLSQALKEELKSREIVTSMLEDNNQIRERLEKSLRNLKESQDQLIHAEKMEVIGRMASDVAHEVKNPLGIILLGINYFEGELPPEEKDNHDTLQMMKDSVKRADGIVRALLDFSRASELKKEQQDINTVIKSAIGLVLHKLKPNSIEPVCELGKDLPETLMDRGKIEQVFVNLFNNAMDAMPKGGKLYVRSYLSELKVPGDKVGNRESDIFRLGEEVIIVEVEDTGAGMDKDIMNKIFDPFFTTKDRTEGTGLGLSVAKSIIEMHRSLIDVESKKGIGTKFTIVIKPSGGG